MIIDKLLATAALCALAATPDIKEPNRAQVILGFTIYNSTNYELQFNNAYTDENYTLPSQTTLTIDTAYNQPNDWYVYYEGDFDEEEINVWYECLDSIGMPSTPSWNYSGSGSYFNVQGMISTCHGLGVYEYRYYDNEDQFINPEIWGGIAKGRNDDLHGSNIRLTPENANSVKLYKENGTYNTATGIYLARTSYEESFNLATMVYAIINNQYINIANNFGYKGTQASGMVGPTDPKAIQPYLTYYNGYTNRVSLGTIELVKAAESYPNTGYMPYGYPYLTDVPVGYIALGQDSEQNTTYALTAGFTFAYMAFTAIAPLFSFVVFPGVSIGLLITIPLIITLLFAVIKLIKKGG